MAYVCLDGKEWVAFQPESSSQEDLAEFMALRNAAKRDIKKGNRIDLERLDAIMSETHTGTSLDDFLQESELVNSPTDTAEASQLAAEEAKDGVDGSAGTESAQVEGAKSIEDGADLIDMLGFV